MVKISKKTGMLSLVVCSLLWSTGGLFIKLVPWHPMVIGGVRGLIAALIIYAAILKLGCGQPAINRQTLLTGAFLGISCMLFVAANKLTTAANAIMLQSANPIFVILFSAVFQHKKTPKRDIITAMLVLGGVALFFVDNLSPGKLLGNILGLISAVTLGSAFIFACSAKSLHETMSGVMLGHLLCGLVGVPFALLFPPELTAQAVGAMLFLGVFQLGSAYVLFSVGAASCPPLAVSLLGMLEPVMNPVWVAVFLHEIPGTTALCGSAIVMITLCCWCVANSKES